MKKNKKDYTVLKYIAIIMGVILVGLLFALLLMWGVKDEKAKKAGNEYYTIKYNLDGGVSSSTSQVVVANGVAIEPESPEKDGYKFDGWYYNGKKFDFETRITESFTIDAHWKKTNN